MSSSKKSFPGPGRPGLCGDVGIVTVSYNSSAQLQKFLEGATSSVSLPTHVIVVDNASHDVAVTQKLARGSGVTVVALDHNAGYGGGANAGVAELPADCAIVVVVNPDVTLDDTSVAVMRETLLSHNHIGIVGPRILNEDGTVYPSARAIPSIRVGAGHALFSRVWPRNPWTRRYHSEVSRRDVASDAGWLSGACLMMRRSTFSDLGGFDSRYFMYFEDVDLGYRAGRLGLRSVYVPQAVVTHVGGASTRSNSRAMLRAHHDSAKKFIAAKYPGARWAPVRWVLSAGLSTRQWIATRDRDSHRR